MDDSRALGALYGLAVGDALGMPTQSLPRARIVAAYGGLVTTFEPAPPDHPLAAGLPAGSVTDDTEQALLLARLLIEGGGRVDPAELARRLLGWERSMRERGSLDLLGPSTRRAIAELLAGADIDLAGRLGATNGAAMRIAPVGIASPGADLGLLVDRVVEASLVTHNTGVALAGAAAVAAAVSAGIDGATVAEATRQAAVAAELAAGRGHWVAAADVGARIGWAADLAAGLSPDAAASAVSTLVGTSLAAQESVPAAFAVLAACPDDPWLACRLAASVGGDCDTIAAMAGAIGGACHGVAGFPAAARRTVDQVNDLHLAEVAAGLLALRSGRSPRRAPQERAGQVPARPFGRLLHLGNVVIDVVLDVGRLPDRGGDVLASAAEVTPGGGFNVMAAALARGLPVGYAGAYGTGPFATLALAALADAGVEVLQRPKPGRDTGFVVAVVEAGGERTFLTSRGAEATLTADDLRGVRAGRSDAVYLTGYSLAHPCNRDAIQDWLDRLDDANLVFFDPGPLAGSIPGQALDRVLRRADWLTCNASEAALLTGCDDPLAAAQALSSRAPSSQQGPHQPPEPRWRPRGGVLVRTGPDGCLLADRGDVVHVPGFEVGAVDTNGAGDTHTGTFAAALARGVDPPEAARIANAAAALSVTRRGPATAPSEDELTRFLTDR
jgi:ADP-ribosylglycohydrolase/sugar/nucleoside kinase (ribokinase family)